MKVYSTFGEDRLDQAVAEWFDGIRLDYPGLIGPFVGHKIRPLYILHDIADNQALLDAALPALGADGFDIEVFNENEQGRVTPEIWVEGVNAVYRDCDLRGFEGKIMAHWGSNLSRESLNAYAKVLPQAPASLVVSFHDYPYGVQSGGRKAWPGTGSPDAALAELIDLAKGRDVVCSEFGWHTFPEEKGWWIFKRTVQLTDQDVYDYLIKDLRRYASHGVKMACIYQWRDGKQPIDNFLGAFGLHTFDSVPKRQLSAVRDWRFV